MFDISSAPMMGAHHHAAAVQDESLSTRFANLVSAHPFLSMAAAVASGLMLSRMSGNEESMTVGWFGPIGKLVKHAVASNPLTLQARYAANMLNPRGGGGGGGAPAQYIPPAPAPDQYADQVAPDQGDGTSGTWHPASTYGMHYMSGFGRGLGRHRMHRMSGSGGHHHHHRHHRPKHWHMLTPPAQQAVSGCAKIIPANVTAGLFGVLSDDQAAPVFAQAINNNPSGPALLRALSDFVKAEKHRKRHGQPAPTAAAMGWSWSDLNPFKSKAGKLLVSTVPGGATAIQAHDIAAKALKNGTLSPEHLKKAGALAKAGRRGDKKALGKIAAIKHAAGKGNAHAEVALDRIKLAHSIQTGTRSPAGPAGGNAISRTFKAGLATINV